MLNSTVIAIQRIVLPTPGIDQLRAESLAEGYSFLDTLIQDWQTGENRFDQPGEILCGSFDQGLLVAVGGLNRDPFVPDTAIGRIRRVYVRSAWRNRGVGRALITFLIQKARETFPAVRLRAENPPAARLYERLGFLPIDDPGATHILALGNDPLIR